MNIFLLGKLWRFSLGLHIHINPYVMSLGTGVTLSLTGRHPHIVLSLSLLFVHLGLTLSFCAHENSLRDHH